MTLPIPREASSDQVELSASTQGLVQRKSYVVSAALESLVLCGLYVACNVFVFPDSPGMIDISPHPTLMIVVLIAARYGFTAAIVAFFTAGLTYGALIYSMAEVPTYLHMVSKPYSTPIAVMVLAATLVGGIVEGHLRRVRKSDSARLEFENENRLLKSKQAELRDVNVELAEKIVASSSTLPALYRYAKALNVGDIQAIYQGLCKLLEEVIEAERVAVWKYEDGKKFLAASQGFGVGEQPLDFEINDNAMRHFDDKGVLASHDIDDIDTREKLPFVVGRIMAGDDGGLAAYVAVEHLPIEKYTPETIRLFGIIVDWASSSVGNAYSMVSEWYEESQVYDSGFTENKTDLAQDMDFGDEFENVADSLEEKQIVIEDRSAQNIPVKPSPNVSLTRQLPRQDFKDEDSAESPLFEDRTFASQEKVPSVTPTKKIDRPDLGSVISSARRPLKPAAPIVKPGSPLRGLPSRTKTRTGNPVQAAAKPRLLRTLDDADGLLKQSRKRRESSNPEMREEVKRASEKNKPLGKLLGEIANYLEKQDKD